jgi:hypothetical protein
MAASFGYCEWIAAGLSYRAKMNFTLQFTKKKGLSPALSLAPA